MALFNKKPTTAEEISKAIANLSDEDKKKVFVQSFKDRLDESVGEQEHLDDNNDSQSSKDRVDESLGETEHDESDETAVTETVDDAGDVVNGENADDEVTEQAATDVQEEHHEDVIQAMAARIEALETRVAEFAEIISSIADLENTDTPLGATAQADVGEADDALSEDDRIMRKYNPNYRRG